MCDDKHPPAVAVDVETLAFVRRRRGFLRALAGAVCALVALPSSRARAKKVGLALAKVGDLQAVGGSKVLKIKDTEILLIRDSEATVRAINPMCTHKKCKVAYKKETNDLFCKCHKSAFKLDGTVVAGPAPRPLQTYPASLKSDQIVIALPD